MSVSTTARDRLIGAAFLLALAGFLLPMWFDGAGVQDLPVLNPAVAPIPASVARPPLQTDGDAWKFTEQMDRAAVDGPLGAPDGGERTQLGQPRTRNDPPARAGVGSDLPWTVQVASLSAVAAGKQLKDKLLAAGFHAYISSGTRSDGTPTVRVYVGPFVDLGEAERVRSELQARMGLQGILKRFDV